MLSLSTVWNHTADLDMRVWLENVRSIGFTAIEMGYTLTHRQVQQIKNVIPTLGMKVSSLHNFSPVPDDEPSPRHPSNYYRLSAIDEHERKQAVRWTKQTMDVAKEVGALFVVIHAGTIDPVETAANQLLKLYKSQGNGTEKYRLSRAEFLRLREFSKKPFMDALERSLDEVLNYAATVKVKIGLETRYYPMEIPNFEEIGLLLKRFDGRDIFYWHDVGHAQVHEYLKFSTQAAFLETYREKMAGAHLHDIKDLRDHHAPFDGELQLETFLDYFKDPVVKVFEVRYASEGQLREARQRFLSRLDKEKI